VTLHAQGSIAAKQSFPNLPVVTQDGRTLKFYDDVIKGKIVVISFTYLACTDICPLVTARMAQLEDKLGDIVGRDIFFVTMTLDPERDTPRGFKEYANAFGTGPGWLFLTGAPGDIRTINARLGDKGRTLDERRDEIVLGNDSTGEWTMAPMFGDLDALVMDIRAMDPRRRVR
jgi:cytochrome oxidase Cu insertion factor (SCO1/SenC/PrrC family)